MIKLNRWPTDSKRITSPFGPRWGAFHDGVDIGGIKPGVEGDNLYAVADGIVIISKINGGGVTKGYGYYIAIQHDGFCTLYGHMQGLTLKVGQTVKAGQVVGKMGNTGTSTAAHLHFRLIEGNTVSFEITADSKTIGSINPEPFLREIKPEVITTSNPTMEMLNVAETKVKVIEVPKWGKEAWDWSVANGINDGKVDSEEEIRTMCYLYRFYQLLKKKGLGT
ncbi:MAG: hypothetical protein CVV02_15145 [Firmicutes bacterium HGW-Firmicutes-7]|nr:MAG: hypothetical protein CVV02_15145 [Firmicutes bacterium HGW-Firmicutes-7]